jgi:hypothetical protein
MAFDIYIGPPKSGKSYVAVNWLLVQWLHESDRLIYHNLPIEAPFWVWLYRTPALRSAAERRCHFLEDKDAEAFSWVWSETYWERADGTEVEPDSWPRNRDKALSRGWRERERVLPEPVGSAGEAEYCKRGAYLAKRSLGRKHQLREWWFFVPPGAVVIIDEAGEIWSTDKRNSRPDELMAVINRHAHFKWDFQMLCHSLNDIDPVLRRKANYVFFVTNSVKEPMFPGMFALRGLTWPVMFFRIRQYLGLDLVAKQPGREVTELDSWNVWPRKRCFENYRSFTHSASLPWLRPADASVKTADFQPSGWRRLLASAKAYRRLLIFGLGVLVAWLGFVWGIKKLLSLANTGTAAAWVGDRGSNSPASAVVVQVGTTNGVVVGTNVVRVTNAVAVRVPERVVWRSATAFRTAKGTYAVGAKVGTNVVARILLDGVIFTDGRSCRYEDLVF